MEVRGQPWSASSVDSILYLETRSLTELEITGLARLVGNEPQGSSSLGLSGAGITNIALAFLLLKVGSED